MKYSLASALICALLLTSACSQSPEKLIAAGNRYHDKKKYTEAYILYQKAITKDKTNAEAYYRQGINLLDEKDPVDAAKYLRRAIDLNPKNSDAETKLAEIYLTVYARDPKRFKTLLPEITDLTNKVLQYDPSSFDGLRLEALRNLVQNQDDKAIEAFAKANQVRPYSPDLVGWYAETLFKVKRPEDAVALLRGMIAHDKKWGPAYDLLFVYYTREEQPAQAEAVLRERVENNPTNAIAIQNLADYLVATNRYNDGEAVMKRVVEDPKAFPQGHELLGDFYQRTGKLDQALQQYQAAVSADPKNALNYQERMVGLYMKMGRRDEALRLAKTLADKNPKSVPVSEMYAELLLQNGSKDSVNQSIRDLKNAIQNNPGDAGLHVELAQAYLRLGQKDKALSEVLEGLQNEAKQPAPRTAVMLGGRILAARIYTDLGQSAKALEQANAVLAAQPQNPEARFLQDRAYIGLGQPGKAQADLEALVQQYPQMIDARLQLGNVYLQEKQPDKAAAQFAAVWNSSAHDPRGFIGMQTVKLSEGHAADAVEAMKDFVQKNPTNLMYRYDLANFEAAAGEQTAASDPARSKQFFQSAVDNYKEILKTTTNSAEIWLRLGALQRQLGQYDAALASFQQAATADPHQAAAILNEGMLLQEMGKEKQALDAYNKALGIDPQNPLALNNVAFLNAQNGTNLDQAMTFAEQAKKSLPNSPDISDTLGYVYLQKNLNIEALQIFRQVVQENPKNPTFRLHLAMALVKQGDRQQAKVQAEQALKDASHPDEQDKIKSFLNQIS